MMTDITSRQALHKTIIANFAIIGWCGSILIFLGFPLAFAVGLLVAFTIDKGVYWVNHYGYARFAFVSAFGFCLGGLPISVTWAMSSHTHGWLWRTLYVLGLPLCYLAGLLTYLVITVFRQLPRRPDTTGGGTQPPRFRVTYVLSRLFHRDRHEQPKPTEFNFDKLHEWGI